ncbi:MAG: hypothetical protein IVW54_16705 [Candidatus Binataceae bacterium]|nr:hypothetical protein [Candidatus Binataceae bacterium]
MYNQARVDSLKGTTVTIRCPWDGRDGDSDTWMQGEIVKTIAASTTGHYVHVVRVKLFKWAEAEAWGPYDGVPEVIAREAPNQGILAWVDTWPRRG